MARGWCSMHYQRWERHGDPLGGQQWYRLAGVEARFWQKVRKTDSCWLWMAASFLPRGGKKPRGVFRWKGKWQLAYRVAYELEIGPIPDGLTLDHLCQNPICVRPDHLEPVTLAENQRRSRAIRVVA